MVSKFEPDPKKDPQAWLVYEAEVWVPPVNHGQLLAEVSDIQSWVDEIYKTAWFEKRFRCVTKGFEIHDGRGSCWARGWSDKNRICHLSIPRKMRTQLTVLHELSHGLTADGHGRWFCSVYLSLMKRFLGYDSWLELRDSFVVCGVRYRKPRERPVHCAFEKYLGIHNW